MKKRNIFFLKNMEISGREYKLKQDASRRLSWFKRKILIFANSNQ
jgi:hypothetical protein